MAKIFITEDDPLMIRVYEKTLKLYGYDVESAADGEEALAKLLVMKEQPNLILLDIMMPKMNGLELLQKLKAEASLKEIPVVFLTNLAGKEDEEKGLALGATAYLVKSQYEPKEIAEKIKGIIASAKK